MKQLLLSICTTALCVCLTSSLTYLPAADTAGKIPFVYRDEYNLHLFGLERYHHFDTARYAKVYAHLRQALNIPADAFYSPEPVTRQDLLLVHTEKYLKAINTPSSLSFILDLKIIRWIPSILIRHFILRPLYYAAGGTYLASTLALERGWGINIGGGFHQAKAEYGGGSSVINDIAITAFKLWKIHPTLKIVFVDLDAHQGNGTASIVGEDPRAVIFNIYNGMIYPWDLNARKFIKYNYPLADYTTDAEYLPLLTRELDSALDIEKPGLIIYNAGTDIFEDDRLGKMKITEKGIIERDQIVFQAALKRNIPIVMVLSGGYTTRNAQIVAHSIENLYKTSLKDYVPGSPTAPHAKK